MSLSPQIILEAIAKEQSKRVAEKSLYEFVKQAWHVVEPGVPFIESWHIQVICDHLQAITEGHITRLLINIPPRHSKSIIVSVMWGCWEWLSRPDEKYLSASYSSVLSIRDNLKARRLVQSPWYQERWGDRFSLSGDQSAKQRFENDRTGYRIATSVGGTATGEGGSRLILDDPHGAQDAQSDAMRESAIEWFNMVWSTRLNNPKEDAMVVVMQRLHHKDISGVIQNQVGVWEHVCIPAEYELTKRKTILGPYDPRTKEGELICPERFGRTEIDSLKVSLGTYGTAGQLQQRPSPAGGGILKTDKFRLWPCDKEMPDLIWVGQSIDTAFTEKTSGDPTGCQVWGLFEYEKRINVLLLDCWNEHLSYPKLKKRVIDDWGARYGGDKKKIMKPSRRADIILVENKGSGQSLLQDLHLSNIPAVPYNPGRADKISRAHMTAPLLENDNWWLLESAKTRGKSRTWCNQMLEQLEQFPAGEHDEMVDCMTQIALYLRDTGQLEVQVAEEEAQDVDYVARRQAKVNPYG
jgi:predicted phage terminase large subunit-like protein